ncbi:uncharacterized protein LOC144107434 [Amblyomma americanum]
MERLGGLAKEQQLCDPREYKFSIIGTETSLKAASQSGPSRIFSADADVGPPSQVSSADPVVCDISESRLQGEQNTIDDMPRIKRESSIPRHTCPDERPLQSGHEFHALQLPSATVLCKGETNSKASSTEELLTPPAQQEIGTQRRYRCDICSKTYAHINNLKAHQPVHTSERPYTCRLCPAAFARRFTLRTHVLDTHNAAGLHACDHCEKKFAFKSNLERHLRVHSGETPHPCHLCPKRFSRRDSLLVHLRMHAGERPYTCVKCDRRFSTASNLGVHVRGVHSSESTYSCKHCPRKYRWRISLNTHVKTYHAQAEKKRALQ